MSANTVDYLQQKAVMQDRLWSPAIWGDCPWNDIVEGNRDSQGVYLFDDFLDWPVLGTQTTEIAFGRWKVFNTGAVKVGPTKTVNSIVIPGGILNLPTDTDNDQASFAQSFPTFFMSGATGTSGKLWFEVRVILNSILTNMNSIFVGLAETDLWTLATGVPFNAGDVITNSAAAVGFRKAEDGLGVWDTVTSDRATSFTNVGASATSVAANTFIKLGMVYDPERTTDIIRFFADGVQLATVISAATLAATTNLKAGLLGFIMASVADSAGTGGGPSIDWVRIAQLLPTVAAI